MSCHYIYILVSEVVILRQLRFFVKVLGGFFPCSRCMKKQNLFSESEIRTQNRWPVTPLFWMFLTPPFLIVFTPFCILFELFRLFDMFFYTIFTQLFGSLGAVAGCFCRSVFIEVDFSITFGRNLGWKSNVLGGKGSNFPRTRRKKKSESSQ